MIWCRKRKVETLLKFPLACLKEERGFGWNRSEFRSWLCHSLAPWPWAATPSLFPGNKMAVTALSHRCVRIRSAEKDANKQGAPMSGGVSTPILIHLCSSSIPLHPLQTMLPSDKG